MLQGVPAVSHEEPRLLAACAQRSEERRVGKEGRFEWCTHQAEDGIRDIGVTGVQTCALPISVQSAQGFRPTYSLRIPNQPTRLTFTKPELVIAARIVSEVTRCSRVSQQYRTRSRASLPPVPRDRKSVV